jgi:hypothetical protein
VSVSHGYWWNNCVFTTYSSVIVCYAKWMYLQLYHGVNSEYIVTVYHKVSTIWAISLCEQVEYWYLLCTKRKPPINNNIKLAHLQFDDLNLMWMYYKISVHTGIICIMMCPSVAVDFCYCYRALCNLRGFLLVQSRYQYYTCSHNDVVHIVLTLW